MTRILVPVRYSAWLSGDLGKNLTDDLRKALSGLHELRLTRLPRGFLIETKECIGPAVEAVARALTEVEEIVAKRYPVFHHEMGPVYTGTVQVILTAVA